MKANQWDITGHYYADVLSTYIVIQVIMLCPFFEFFLLQKFGTDIFYCQIYELRGKPAIVKRNSISLFFKSLYILMGKCLQRKCIKKLSQYELSPKSL